MALRVVAEANRWLDTVRRLLAVGPVGLHVLRVDATA
jgi:hypothetical protein